MRHLASYFKERDGFDCLFTEEAFATYKIAGDECYIRDIWVHRDFRKGQIASKLANDIAEIAKRAGCKFLSGSVSTTAANSPTDSAKVLLAYGFLIHNAVPGGIFFRKEL